ncbi:MAG: protein-export chaperone SecB [candidate division WOR-3 bacterium]
MLSPLLHLDGFFIERLNYQALPTFNREQPPRETLSVDYSINKGRENSYMLRLTIELGKGVEDNARCQLHLSIIGFFTIEEEIDERTRVNMLFLNAPSILYGIARQVVAETTGNGPWGKVFLPTVNFVELAKTKMGKAAGQKDRPNLAYSVRDQRQKNKTGTK